MISVVIVNWNARNYLVECLASVCAQQVSVPVETIVVDNASSDGSQDEVRRRYPSVSLIQNPDNYGFARANNIGIRASQGDYLVLVNSDAVVAPACFEHMRAFMDENPDIGIAGPRIVDRTGKTQRSCMGYPTLWNTACRALALDRVMPTSRLFGGQLLTHWNHDEQRDVDVVNGCFWIIRRTALDQVGLLDERFWIYGEDVDWCKRFRENGWRVVFTPHAQALHHGGGSSSNAPIRFYLEMQRAQYQYWQKHHSRMGAVGFLVISTAHHVLRAAGSIATYPVSRSRGAFPIKRSIAAMRWSLATLAADVRTATGVGAR